MQNEAMTDSIPPYTYELKTLRCFSGHHIITDNHNSRLGMRNRTSSKTTSPQPLAAGARPDGRNGSVAVRALLFVLLLTVAVAIGLGVGYFRHTYHPSSTISLSQNISFKGLSEEMLRLDQREIGKLNSCAVRHRNTFPDVAIMVDGKGILEVQESSVLSWSMSLSTHGESSVQSWPRTCKRKHLVESIVKYMDTAADEYHHLQDMPDIMQSIHQIYI